MFCPNCGNNCENANFCPKCGTKLPQQAQNESAVWQIGMPCPHCGGTQMDGQCCSFCGARLISEVVEQAPCRSKWATLPLGVYRGYRDAYLILRDDHLIIKNEHWDEVSIPYEKITKVKYVAPAFLRFGSFSVRWTANEHLPIPEAYLDAGMDKTTVLFPDYRDDDFHKVYHAFKDIL